MSAFAVRKLRLDSLVLSGTFKRRLAAKHVKDLAESIREHGLLDLPIVEAGSKRVLAGEDRIAALTLLEIEAHEMRVVPEMDPWQFRRAHIASNLHRRADNQDELTRVYVEILAEKASSEGGFAAADAEPDNPFADVAEPGLRNNLLRNSEPKPAHRPKTPKGKAREKVAAEMGKTPAAVKQAEYRARKAEQAVEAPETPMVAPVAGWHLADVPESAGEVRQLLAKAASLVAQAKGCVTQAIGADKALVDRFPMHQLQHALKELGDRIRACTPSMSCYRCKGLRSLGHCPVCADSGWLPEGAHRDAPRELLVEGPEAVVHDRGRLVKVAEVKR